MARKLSWHAMLKAKGVTSDALINKLLTTSQASSNLSNTNTNTPLFTTPVINILHAFSDVAATGYGYRGLGSYSNIWQTIKDTRPLRARQELVYLPTWYLQLQLATPFWNLCSVQSRNSMGLHRQREELVYN